MKTKTHLTLIVLAMACVFALAAAPVLAAEVTITGQVTEDGQIIATDGEIYDVSSNEKADELMDQVGKTIEATGTLAEESGVKSIMVTQFKVLEK